MAFPAVQLLSGAFKVKAVAQGLKAPPSLFCQGHLASLWLEHTFFFFFAKLHLFCSPALSWWIQWLPRSPPLPGLFWIICIDVSHSSPPRLLVRGCQKHCWRKWKYPHYANAGLRWWHVLFYKLHPPCQKSNCIWVTSEELSQDFNLARLQCHHQFSQSKYRHISSQTATWLCGCVAAFSQSYGII